MSLFSVIVTGNWLTRAKWVGGFHRRRSKSQSETEAEISQKEMEI